MNKQEIYGIGCVYPAKYKNVKTVVLQPLSLEVFNDHIKYNDEVYDINNIDKWPNGEITIYTNDTNFFIIRQVDDDFDYQYIRSLISVPVEFRHLFKINKWIECFMKNKKHIIGYTDLYRIISFYLIKYLNEYDNKSYAEIAEYFGCNKSTILRSCKENRPLNLELSHSKISLHTDFSFIIIALTNKGE